MKAYQDAVRNAKSPEDQQKVYREKYPNKMTYAPKFVEIAEKNPQDPVALDALAWVLEFNFGSQSKNDPRVRAVDLLIQHHIQSEKLGPVCQSLRINLQKVEEKLLRAVLENNPHKNVQAEACLALAQNRAQFATFVKRVQERPDVNQWSYYSKEEFEHLLKTDPVKVEAESARLFKEFADKHLVQLNQQRLTSLCQNLVYSGGNSADVLLRTVLEKDPRREVQGMACLALGQVLKKQADRLPATDKSAAAVRAESEKLLERAQEKYGDVKMSYYGTVGAKAKGELFDLRNLSVGKTAPEVEGIDQDGRKFKISDYRGKVVFLDFWSQY